MSNPAPGQPGQPTGPERPGARVLARRAMKAQVGAMALDLFLRRGYDRTTVEDICDVAGISRSTFFRYFSSKEDAALGAYADRNDDLLAALTGRPDDEAPWTALSRAVTPHIDRYAGDPDRALQLAGLVTTTPALAALRRQQNAGWHHVLRPELARRLGADPHDLADPRPAALINAALGCVEATFAAWVAIDGATPLIDILDRAMACLAAPAAGPMTVR